MTTVALGQQYLQIIQRNPYDDYVEIKYVFTADILVAHKYEKKNI